ncbi:MAG: DNA alkylation repair protein [Cytophagales bacterium]|nr:MAG: DNA alkylation repair protein [Cytophagales bacterium]
MTETILAELQSYSKPSIIEGMKRFGINTEYSIGVSIPNIRAIAKRYKNNHSIALNLWATQIHEARILATMIDDPKQVSPQQMEEWVLDFNSWDICDQCCGNLFDKTPIAFQVAMAWASRKEEYVKRAGFVMMATLAVHHKKAVDTDFYPFFNLIITASDDERNFVKKALNWALRQIGKRNSNLHQKALECCDTLLSFPHKSALWIAKDAQRELNNQKIIARILKKNIPKVNTKDT